MSTLLLCCCCCCCCCWLLGIPGEPLPPDWEEEEDEDEDWDEFWEELDRLLLCDCPMPPEFCCCCCPGVFIPGIWNGLFCPPCWRSAPDWPC